MSGDGIKPEDRYRDMLLNAGQYLDGNPPPSELLVLPWGGVARRSEFRGAFKVKHKNKWVVRSYSARGSHTWPEQGVEESSVDEWLADIEEQLRSGESGPALAPPQSPYTDNGEGQIKAALEREGFTNVSVTIGKATS